MPGGRPRQPDSLKAAKGTLQKCRTNSEQPQVKPGMPEIPRGLTGIAKRKFVELSQELHQMKVITPHDRFILEQVAKEFALLSEMEKTIKKDGHFYNSRIIEEDTEFLEDGTTLIRKKEKVTKTSVRSHPALTIRNQCWANIMKGLQECGLTPSTRSKLKVVKKEESNPFLKLSQGG